MEYQMIEFTTRSIYLTVCGALIGALCGAAYAFTEASANERTEQ